jgi:hypothetical protein
MKPEKRTVAFLGGASIVLIVILALPSRHPGLELQVPTPVSPSQAGPTIDAGDDSVLLLEQRRRASELTWARDPFAPAAKRLSSPSSEPSPASRYLLQAPKLTGVSMSGVDRRAVIDRQIVQEGDRLPSGYTIARITARTVTLLRDHEELTLSLGEEQ